MRNHRLSVVLSVAAAVFSGLQLVALQRARAIDALTGVSASRATCARRDGVVHPEGVGPVPGG